MPQDISERVFFLHPNAWNLWQSGQMILYTDIIALIPVKEMCPFGNPVARSQARRILRRLEEFQEIIFDFRDVEILGQGFADEVFRVFQNRYPEIVLTVQNANKSVQGMIRHVSGGRNKIYPL